MEEPFRLPKVFGKSAEVSCLAPTPSNLSVRISTGLTEPLRLLRASCAYWLKVELSSLSPPCGSKYRNTVQLYVMPTETSYTSLRQNLATVLASVADDQEIVIVRRKGAKDVALVPAAELAGLMETAHLLRSPRNARRLLSALRRAKLGQGKPVTVKKLRREVGLSAAGR
jgi:antitoxin YefM